MLYVINTANFNWNISENSVKEDKKVLSLNTLQLIQNKSNNSNIFINSDSTW